MASLTLTQLYEHPLKSARGNLVDSALVEPEGLSRDRRFMVHTADGTFISGRRHPRLVLISVKWDGLSLELSAPGAPPLVHHPVRHTESKVVLWRDRFAAWDQGDATAHWLSRFLQDDLRLAWLGESQRLLKWDHERRATFADAAPLLAVGAGSLADLSKRMGEDMQVRRFRPNLFIEGAQPFEEDGWRRFRIGEVEFLNLDGCGRCEFTTIDPDTAERHARAEPVTTLESFRKNDVGIYFGMNLMPLNGGTLRVGDKVTILDRRRPLTFVSWSLPPVESRWNGEASLVCTATREEGPGVKTLRLERQDGQSMSWDAGQYLTLKLDLPEGPLRRSYTISSSPSSGGNAWLEITVKRLEDGRGSTFLHDHVFPGSVVVSETVAGEFTLATHPWNTLLFLGAGSGVTPLISLLRWMADLDLPLDVAFHQSARTRADLLFTEELSRLKGKLGDRLVLASRITSEEGHLDYQGLMRFCPDLRDRKAFVCGPAGYRATVRELLNQTGFKVDRRYHEELFGEAALEVPDDAEPGEVTFSRLGKTVPSDGKTTVLQLAERVGIDLPSSCRSGDCGTCRVQNAAGEWLLACHSFPSGDQSYQL